MKCLVFVKFLPGGSIQPDNFFTRINAEYSWVEGISEPLEHSALQKARSGLCIADFDSIEQLTIDLAVMSGTGISNIEIMPTEDHIIESYFGELQQNPEMSH